MKRAALLLLFLFAVWMTAMVWRSCERETKTAPQVTAPSAGKNASAALTPDRSATGTPGTPAAPNATTTSAYQMRALTFTIDASGIRFERAVTTPGRVKAPPQSVAPDRIEFEVYDRNGEKIYAGSLDHPLHRTLEYEDATHPGTLRHTTKEESEGALQIRLPDSLAADRIAFFEIRTSPSGSALRTALAALPLR